MSNLKLKSRMKNLLMFLPNMIALCARLMVDKRVPRTERALFAAAVIYAIIPFDFIPDMIPFVGQVDDIFLIALTRPPRPWACVATNTFASLYRNSVAMAADRAGLGGRRSP